MAEVWLAIDLTLDRKVAGKWLKPHLATDPIVAERFRREAVAAASLSHPNIVAVHDVFEQDGRQAVVMQLVEGKSLRQLGLETADRVAVMYRGERVEVGTVDRSFANPQHPYTKGLIACRPQLDRRMRILPTVADFMEVTTDEAGAMQIVERTPDFESQAIDGEGEVGDRSDL